MAADTDQAAPHIVDLEVFGVVRREHRLGRLDGTQANHDATLLTTDRRLPAASGPACIIEVLEGRTPSG